ncbi:MAG TPA: cytochrome C oxidase subunit IV family protein [Anaerolineae bacterium]|nr:cytochrome C oxidase subunit IV family protein [Anaerolineae bacterium]
MQDSHHSAPRYLQYIGIAVILGALTGIEFLVVSEFWPAALSEVTVPILLVLTVIKAALVALFYMHLKFDSRLYSALFVGVIVLLALPLVIVLMILFQSTA